ncbi:hypothetical protein [uncultured Jatrophihabitans sp.]|uniref:hypothetical protein n=1 Tax=uncultured Jatrophihabitans sp. TaxID=1610747 RepID=UPI0035CBDFD3
MSTEVFLRYAPKLAGSESDRLAVLRSALWSSELANTRINAMATAAATTAATTAISQFFLRLGGGSGDHGWSGA